MSGRAKVEDEDRQIRKNLFLLDAKGDWVRQRTHSFSYTNVTTAADISTIKAMGKTASISADVRARACSKRIPGAAIALSSTPGGSAIAAGRKPARRPTTTDARPRAPIQNAGVIKGILWHQGEWMSLSARKYLDSLAAVIEQFRKDLAQPMLPFVAGQIAPLPRGKDKIRRVQPGPAQVADARAAHARRAGRRLERQGRPFDMPRRASSALRYADQMIQLQGK